MLRKRYGSVHACESVYKGQRKHNMCNSPGTAGILHLLLPTIKNTAQGFYEDPLRTISFFFPEVGKCQSSWTASFRCPSESYLILEKWKYKKSRTSYNFKLHLADLPCFGRICCLEMFSLVGLYSTARKYWKNNQSDISKNIPLAFLWCAWLYFPYRVESFGKEEELCKTSCRGCPLPISLLYGYVD